MRSLEEAIMWFIGRAGLLSVTPGAWRIAVQARRAEVLTRSCARILAGRAANDKEYAYMVMTDYLIHNWGGYIWPQIEAPKP